MRRIPFAASVLLAGVAVAIAVQTGSAQSYSRGQNISPALEWSGAPKDTTYDAPVIPGMAGGSGDMARHDMSYGDILARLGLGVKRAMS